MLRRLHLRRIHPRQDRMNSKKTIFRMYMELEVVFQALYGRWAVASYMIEKRELVPCSCFFGGK